MSVGQALGNTLASALDKLIEARYEPPRRAVDKLRDEHHSAPPSQISDALIRRYRKELAAAGAAAGGVASVPGLGTVISLSATGADVTWTFARLGEMILSIGAAYGHDVETIEERRAWLVAVLGLASVAAEGVADTAAQVGARGGMSAVKAIPISRIRQVNSVLRGRYFVKFETQQGVVRLGTVVPFGIGAAIGSRGNALLVQSVGNRAKSFFDDRLDKQDGLSSAADSP